MQMRGGTVHDSGRRALNGGQLSGEPHPAISLPEGIMRLACHIACGLAGALIAAVASVPAAAQAPAVRDSAGIRIVENPSRLEAPVAFTLGARPSFDVGGLESDPDAEFNHRQGYLRGTFLSDGRFAVIDVVRVHFFDATGKRTKIRGREGAGPEEFRYLTSICRTRGDTLVLEDGQNRRVAIMDGNGNFVRTIPQRDLGSPPFDACFDDGTFLLEHVAGPRAALQDHLTRVRLDGSVADTLGVFPSGFDIVTQSETTVLAAGATFYYGDPATNEIRVYDRDGRLRRIVRSDDPPERISDAEVERKLAGSIPATVSPAERKARMDQMRAVPHSATWPAFRGVEVGSDGRLWMQDYQRTHPSPDGWTAFDSTGRLLGRLVIPSPVQRVPPFQVIAFGRDGILVRRWDADQATHLTVYPLVPVHRP